jgi:hypothetical protein
VWVVGWALVWTIVLAPSVLNALKGREYGRKEGGRRKEEGVRTNQRSSDQDKGFSSSVILVRGEEGEGREYSKKEEEGGRGKEEGGRTHQHSSDQDKGSRHP